MLVVLAAGEIKHILSLEIRRVCRKFSKYSNRTWNSFSMVPGISASCPLILFIMWFYVVSGSQNAFGSICLCFASRLTPDEIRLSFEFLKHILPWSVLNTQRNPFRCQLNTKHLKKFETQMPFQNYDIRSLELSSYGRLDGMKVLCLFEDGIDMPLIHFDRQLLTLFKFKMSIVLWFGSLALSSFYRNSSVCFPSLASKSGIDFKYTALSWVSSFLVLNHWF